MGSYSGTITASADDAAQNVANMNLTGPTSPSTTHPGPVFFKNVTIAQGDDHHRPVDGRDRVAVLR